MNKPLIKTFDEILSDLIPLLDMTDDTAKSVLKAKKEKLFKAVQARDTGVLGENRKTPSKKKDYQGGFINGRFLLRKEIEQRMEETRGQISTDRS
jgi:hypothetical protein